MNKIRMFMYELFAIRLATLCIRIACLFDPMMEGTHSVVDLDDEVANHCCQCDLRLRSDNDVDM